MDQREYQTSILKQMANNEESLSELYAIYMHKFPSRRDFWRSIAQEEVGHANWIRTLQAMVDSGTVLFKEGRFNIDSLNDFNDFIKKQENKAKNEIPLIEALVSSKELEETFLEKEFFRVFEGDGPELETLLLALEYSTKNHREIITKAWQEERVLISQ